MQIGHQGTGDVTLPIPNLRAGLFFPSVLEPAGAGVILRCVRPSAHRGRSHRWPLLSLPLSELVYGFRARDGVDLIRESVRTVLQDLMAPSTPEPHRYPQTHHSLGGVRHRRSSL